MIRLCFQYVTYVVCSVMIQSRFCEFSIKLCISENETGMQSETCVLQPETENVNAWTKCICTLDQSYFHTRKHNAFIKAFNLRYNPLYETVS